LELALLRQVAAHYHEADGSRRVVHHLRESPGHRAAMPVFRRQVGFDAPGKCAGRALGEQTPDAGGAGLVAVVEERAAFQLLERVAGGSLSRLIPSEDVAFGVGGDDNIAGALDDAGEMAL